MIHTAPQLWLPGDPLDDRPRRDRRRLPRFREYGIGYPCCPECKQEVPTCVRCSGAVPWNLEVEFSGVVDDSCGECDTYWNTTHRLTWDHNCYWQTLYAGDIDCGDTWTHLVVYWTYNLGLYYLVAIATMIHTTQESVDYWFYDVWDSEQVCEIDGDIILPYWQTVPELQDDCDFTGATCTVRLS